MHSRFSALAILGLRIGLTTTAMFGFALPALSQPFRNEWIASRRASDTCVNAAQSQGFPVLEVLNQNDYTGGSEIVMQVREGRSSVTLGCDYADNTGRVQLYRLNDPRNSWSTSRDGRYSDDGWRNRDWNDNRSDDYNGDNNWRNRDWNGSRGDDYSRDDGWRNRDGNDQQRRDDWHDWRNDNWHRDRYQSSRSYDLADGVNSDAEAELIARRAVANRLGVDANSNLIEVHDLQEGDRNWRVEGSVNGAPFQVLIRTSDGSVADFRLR